MTRVTRDEQRTCLNKCTGSHLPVPPLGAPPSSHTKLAQHLTLGEFIFSLLPGAAKTTRLSVHSAGHTQTNKHALTKSSNESFADHICTTTATIRSAVSLRCQNYPASISSTSIALPCTSRKASATQLGACVLLLLLPTPPSPPLPPPDTPSLLRQSRKPLQWPEKSRPAPR